MGIAWSNTSEMYIGDTTIGSDPPFTSHMAAGNPGSFQIWMFQVAYRTYFCGHGEDGGNSWYIRPRLSMRQLRLVFAGEALTAGSFDDGRFIGQWIHCVFVRRANGNTEWWIDNNNYVTEATGDPAPVAAPAIAWNVAATSNYTDNSAAEMAMWRRELTPAEIGNLSSGTNPLDTSPDWYWPMTDITDLAEANGNSQYDLLNINCFTSPDGHPPVNPPAGGAAAKTLIQKQTVQQMGLVT